MRRWVLYAQEGVGAVRSGAGPDEIAEISDPPLMAQARPGTQGDLKPLQRVPPRNGLAQSPYRGKTRPTA